MLAQQEDQTVVLELGAGQSRGLLVGIVEAGGVVVIQHTIMYYM